MKIPSSVNLTKKYLLVNKKGKIIKRFRLKLTALRWQSPNTKVITLKEWKDRKPFDSPEIVTEM